MVGRWTVHGRVVSCRRVVGVVIARGIIVGIRSHHLVWRIIIRVHGVSRWWVHVMTSHWLVVRVAWRPTCWWIELLSLVWHMVCSLRPSHQMTGRKTSCRIIVSCRKLFHLRIRIIWWSLPHRCICSIGREALGLREWRRLDHHRILLTLNQLFDRVLGHNHRLFVFSYCRRVHHLF